MDCSPQPAKRAVISNCGGLLSSCSYPTVGSPVSQFSSPGGGPSSNNSGAGYPFNYTNTALHPQYFPASHPQQNSQNPQVQNSSTSTSSNSLMSMITNQVEQDSSPFSNETESVSSSIGGCDSPFFRPVDSPLAASSVTTSPEDSPRPLHPKI